MPRLEMRHLKQRRRANRNEDILTWRENYVPEDQGDLMEEEEPPTEVDEVAEVAV